jgi:hypothetical protein
MIERRPPRSLPNRILEERRAAGIGDVMLMRAEAVVEG